MKTIKLDGVEISEDKLREIIKNNPKLVEEKKGRWKPEDGNIYFTIKELGDIDWVQWVGSDYDNWNWKTNNVFRTKEEAAQRKAEIEALAKINDYIDDNGLRLSEEEIVDSEVNKYYVYYSIVEKSFNPSLNWGNIHLYEIGNLKSEESARKIIDKFEEELKIVFKIK